MYVRIYVCILRSMSQSVSPMPSGVGHSGFSTDFSFKSTPVIV